jgi:hypothetical protein
MLQSKLILQPVGRTRLSSVPPQRYRLKKTADRWQCCGPPGAAAVDAAADREKKKWRQVGERGLWSLYRDLCPS